MSTARRLAVAGVVAAAVALAPAGVARADNNNSNTNTNDVTQLGGVDFSAGAVADESTNWPPTDLGWPPREILSGGENENGVNETSGNNGRNESAPTPIVMPAGQSPPTQMETPSTPEPAKPIVGVSSP
jgi:hypothetical protein